MYCRVRVDRDGAVRDHYYGHGNELWLALSPGGARLNCARCRTEQQEGLGVHGFRVLRAEVSDGL